MKTPVLIVALLTCTVVAQNRSPLDLANAPVPPGGPAHRLRERPSAVCRAAPALDEGAAPSRNRGAWRMLARDAPRYGPARNRAGQHASCGRGDHRKRHRDLEYRIPTPGERWWRLARHLP